MNNYKYILQRPLSQVAMMESVVEEVGGVETVCTSHFRYVESLNWDNSGWFYSRDNALVFDSEEDARRIKDRAVVELKIIKLNLPKSFKHPKVINVDKYLIKTLKEQRMFKYKKTELYVDIKKVVENELKDFNKKVKNILIDELSDFYSDMQVSEDEVAEIVREYFNDTLRFAQGIIYELADNRLHDTDWEAK